mmetsp:Transcript_25956/g.65780  ORF Transcript_25956/g.65780 Transcript_25956/m.65780 type:complete len:222 (+) Transcript_25956:299-964(+)
MQRGARCRLQQARRLHVRGQIEPERAVRVGSGGRAAACRRHVRGLRRRVPLAGGRLVERGPAAHWDHGAVLAPAAAGHHARGAGHGWRPAHGELRGRLVLRRLLPRLRRLPLRQCAVLKDRRPGGGARLLAGLLAARLAPVHWRGRRLRRRAPAHLRAWRTPAQWAVRRALRRRQRRRGRARRRGKWRGWALRRGLGGADGAAARGGAETRLRPERVGQGY